MRKQTGNFLAIGILLVLITAFFFTLFYPHPKFLLTPDFGRSDAWHFSLSTKFIYWEALKNNHLPFWTHLLGGGFPLFAEGQIGALFLPNVFLFRLFDFPFAYNASLVFAVMTFALGIYFLVRTYTGSTVSAFFGAITGALSGIIIPQLPHITLTQGVSLMPWVFLATYRLMKKQTVFRMSVLAFILAEQIYTGFPQVVFISLIFSTGFCIWMNRPLRKNIRLFLFYGCAVLFGIGLSGAQLLPSVEFLSQSSVAKGFSVGEATYFSYPVRHIKTLIDPFILGNPKEGTYPHFASFDGSIFWENTAYIGWLPIIFAVLAILRGLTPGAPIKTRKMTWFLGVSLGLALLLMTGKHSPLYILYSFWPFTLFRVPSRFIWIFEISFILLASLGIAQIISIVKNISHTYRRYLCISIIGILIFSHTYQLWNTWGSYHLYEDATLWLSKPASLDGLSKDDRVYTIGSEKLHNTFFVPNGWTNTEPYRSLREALAPDSNAFWHIPSGDVYAGRNLRKNSLLTGMLLAETTYGDNTATISALGQKILSLQGVHTIISLYPVTAERLTLSQTRKDSSIGIYIYSNQNSAPLTYIAENPVVALTVTDAAAVLRKDTFLPGSSALVPAALALDTNPKGNAAIAYQSDDRISINVEGVTAPAVLVLANTYYPGWTGTVDGKVQPIFPVNISGQGIRVPSGNHRVELTFIPKSFLYGVGISAASFVIMLIVMVYPVLFSLFRKDPGVPVPGQDFYRSHAREKLRKG